jgi:hypothetical protein
MRTLGRGRLQTGASGPRVCAIRSAATRPGTSGVAGSGPEPIRTRSSGRPAHGCTRAHGGGRRGIPRSHSDNLVCGEIAFRIDRALPDISLTGSRPRRIRDFVSSRRKLKGRAKAEAARRGQRPPPVEIPRYW